MDTKCWSCGRSIEHKLGDGDEKNLCSRCIEEGWWFGPDGELYGPQDKFASLGKELETMTANELVDSLLEKAPPGWEGTVRAMKKHKDVDNPWALAWSMKNKGYKPHKKRRKGVSEAAENCLNCGRPLEGDMRWSSDSDYCTECAATAVSGIKLEGWRGGLEKKLQDIGATNYEISRDQDGVFLKIDDPMRVAKEIGQPEDSVDVEKGIIRLKSPLLVREEDEGGTLSPDDESWDYPSRERAKEFVNYIWWMAKEEADFSGLWAPKFGDKGGYYSLEIRVPYKNISESSEDLEQDIIRDVKALAAGKTEEPEETTEKEEREDKCPSCGLEWDGVTTMEDVDEEGVPHSYPKCSNCGHKIEDEPVEE